MIEVICAHCGEVTLKAVGAVNRARDKGSGLYCDKTCFGLSRRLTNPPTEAERKEDKRLYDANRRAAKCEEILAKKRAYYYANKERINAEQAAYRAKHMDRHVAYCQQPEYKEWKREYDRRYRAVRDFGEFSDAALLLLDIEQEISEKATRYEVYQANGTLNKAQTRRRSL